MCRLDGTAPECLGNVALPHHGQGAGRDESHQDSNKDIDVVMSDSITGTVCIVKHTLRRMIDRARTPALGPELPDWDLAGNVDA